MSIKFSSVNIVILSVYEFTDSFLRRKPEGIEILRHFQIIYHRIYFLKGKNSEISTKLFKKKKNKIKLPIAFINYREIFNTHILHIYTV